MLLGLTAMSWQRPLYLYVNLDVVLNMQEFLHPRLDKFKHIKILIVLNLEHGT